MFDGSMSESTNKAAVNVRSRLFRICRQQDTQAALPNCLTRYWGGGLFSVQDEVVLDFKLTGACRLDTSSNC